MGQIQMPFHSDKNNEEISIIHVCTYSFSEIKWVKFKEKFEKEYESLEHEMERKEIFLSTLEEVEKHNMKFDKGLSTYQQGINYFSDWTWDEFQVKYLNKIAVVSLIHSNIF